MGTIKEISDPTIVIGALTDAGRSGKNNEDNFVVFESQSGGKEGTTSRAMAETVQVLMVADGIGGNVAGETASQMAVDTFHTAFTGAKSQSVSQRLVEALDSANHAIYQKSIDQPNLQGMGTTVVAAALVGNRLYVAHAGDSRAYLIRKGKAQQLTLDHTWAQEAIEAGRLTAAQAREHPNRHVIKRFVGIAPTVDVDPMLLDINRGPLDPDQIQSWPKSDYLDLQPDDIVLLCSDGLTDVVSDKEIEQTVSRHQPQEAARKLIDLANKAGGPDNITVLILQRRQPGAPVAKPGGRSPVMAVGIIVVLVALVATIGLVLQNRWSNNNNTIVATKTALAVANAAAAIITPITAPTATTTPTDTGAPPTDTATPSDTPSPSPTIGATTTPTSTTITANAQSDLAAVVNQGGEGVATNISNILDGTPVTTTPAMTITPTSTRPRPPTSTPVIDTPTPSATPTPTITPTSNRVLATPTASRIPATGTSQAPVAPASSIPANAQVVLQQPGIGDTLNSKVQFSWLSNFTLPQGYAFEPVFWTKGQSAMQGLGYGGATDKSEMSLGPDNFTTPGEHFWTVLLIRSAPYERVKTLSEERLIIIEFPSSSSGAGSSGGDRDK